MCMVIAMRVKIGIGQSRLSSPATPPDMQVRIQWFGHIELSTIETTEEVRVSRIKRSGTHFIAGLLAMRHGPCELAAVCAANLLPTPLWRRYAQTVACRVSIASRSRIAACAYPLIHDLQH
jgi:hypothetical protein